MPYTLKTSQISVKDPETGEYSGVDILAEQTEQGLIAELQAEGTTQVNRINQAAVDVQAAVDQAETDAATIISDTQTSISTLEAQKNTIAQTVASMAELGTDTTLSTPGMAADAGAVGDLNRQLSDVESAFDAVIAPKRTFTGQGFVTMPCDIFAGHTYIVNLTSGRIRLFTRQTESGANVEYIIGNETPSTAQSAPYTTEWMAGQNASYLRVASDAAFTFDISDKNGLTDRVTQVEDDIDIINQKLEYIQSFSCPVAYKSYPAIIETGKTYIVNLTSGTCRLYTRAESEGANIDNIVGDPTKPSTAKTGPFKTKFTATADANYIRVAADSAVAFSVTDCSTITGQLELLKYDGVFGLFEYKPDIYSPYPQLPANTDPDSDFDADNMTSQDVYDYIDAIMAKYPQLLTKTVMGKDASNTYDVNRYVYADSARSSYFGTIYIGANEHGPSSDPRECAIVVCRFLKDLCEGHAKTNRFLNIIKKYFRVVCIPVANPWGFNTNHRNNYNDVNINRNYPTVPGWENCPDADKGSSPASEVETQYIVSTIETFNPDIALDLHCLGYGTLANDKKCAYAGVVKNQALMDELVDVMKRDYDLTCTVYGVGDYMTHSDGDSYFAYKGIDGMLLEFQARDGTTGSSSAVLHSANIVEAGYTFMLRILNILMTVHNSAWDTRKV